MEDEYVPEHRGVPDGDSDKSPLLNDKLYDRLKFCALIVFPALGTLYFTIAQIWGLPKADEVVGTIVAIDAFLGVLLGISNRSYEDSDAQYDGELEVFQTEEGNALRVVSNHEIDDVVAKKGINLKVKPM